MKEAILKQIQVFPTVTRGQLYRLVKSYRGHCTQSAFEHEFKKLILAGKIEQVTTDRSIEYRITSKQTKAEAFAAKLLES